MTELKIKGLAWRKSSEFNVYVAWCPLQLKNFYANSAGEMEGIDLRRRNSIREALGYEKEVKPTPDLPGYNYSSMAGIFNTDRGQKLLIDVYRAIRRKNDETPVRLKMRDAINGILGDSWETIAAIERLCDLGQLGIAGRDDKNLRIEDWVVFGVTK